MLIIHNRIIDNNHINEVVNFYTHLLTFHSWRPANRTRTFQRLLFFGLPTDPKKINNEPWNSVLIRSKYTSFANRHDTVLPFLLVSWLICISFFNP